MSTDAKNWVVEMVVYNGSFLLNSPSETERKSSTKSKNWERVVKNTKRDKKIGKNLPDK